MAYCGICCNDAQEFLTCPHCSNEACYDCNEKYLLLELKDPECMFCFKKWTLDFVLENFSGKWLRAEFLPHIGKFLLEKEKMLLPDTQNEALLVKQIKELSQNRKNLQTIPQIKKIYKSNSEDKIDEIRQERVALESEIKALKQKSITFGSSDLIIKSTPKTYIMKCPTDDCRGFIGTDYVCGTCICNVCKACHVLKSHDHICNNDDILSAKLVKEQTKPCPKCMVSILKSGGCDQMFCTQCHITFSWNSGIINTGPVHNPHYFEWIAANNNLNIEEVACGEIPHINNYYRTLQNICPDRLIQQKLLEIYRIITHIREEVIPNYREDRVKDNFDLRVQYLLNEFDEKKWAIKLINREKKRIKNAAFCDILELLVTILSDFVRQIMYVKLADISSIIKQYDKLKTFYLETLDRITIIHGGTIPLNLLENIF